ncbi:MAG: hypothetical protein P8Q91_09800 [Porticoccaceae bacterium]|nr:hypothetical protein [Porticoccaceae bacterium]
MIQSVLAEVSIIIPLAAGENQQQYLLADLASRPLQAEIIKSYQTSSEQSRASSLNAGAEQAVGPWLWFLHADSRVSQDNLRALEHSLERDQQRAALHYFDLGFIAGGPLLSTSARGANLRSRLLMCPYGDQGFCISKQLFLALGGFPEGHACGEDLLLVWRAHQAAVALQPIASTLLTSGRKYHRQGWLKVTALHQWYWLRLSLPELFKLAVQRCRRR